MDIYEALYTTRAMRRLKPDPIPYEVQARILDAAIRAPNINQEWRFILVDDQDVKSRLATLYLQAWERLFKQQGVNLADLLQLDNQIGRMASSGDHLARNFKDVPLVLIGFSKTRDGSGIYPALWSAMLAARAEGIGSTLTGVLQSFFPDEVFEILGAPKDAGWNLNGVITMGYPKGRWGIAPRKPVQEVAARNNWQGDLGFTVPDPLWKAS
jgi:nitroreductase